MFTKTSKVSPSKALTRKFYHWPSAIGVREQTSMEELSAQILSSVGSILDEHSKVVRDELFTLREATRELKNTVDSMKEENSELKKQCTFLLGEMMHLSKDVSELKTAKGNGFLEGSLLGIPGTSSEDKKDPSIKPDGKPTEERHLEKSRPKSKFTTRSAKTDWFWTAAKEKISSGDESETSNSEGLLSGKTSYRQRKAGKEREKNAARLEEQL